MFGRYTEEARRAIFYARFEASQFGASRIECEHLLIGLLRAEHEVFHALGVDVAQLRETVERESKNWQISPEKVNTAVDMPLSNGCKRVLAYAAEEAGLAPKHIGTEHLVLGLLREERSAPARILREQGVDLASGRLKIQNWPPASSSGV